MRDDERLHRRRVLLHHVADARIGVDDDLVGEAHLPGAVDRLVLGEMLSERPVPVEQRHADRGVGVEHLLGGDDLDLVRIGVETELLARDHLDRVVDALDGLKVPIPALEQKTLGQAFGHGAAAFCWPSRRWNSSRNTG
jgi:hypothetical protein